MAATGVERPGDAAAGGPGREILLRAYRNIPLTRGRGRDGDGP